MNGRENCWGKTCTLERTQTQLCALDVTTRYSWNSGQTVLCTLHLNKARKEAGGETGR